MELFVRALLSLLAASLLAGLAWWKKALTPRGLVLAWGLALAIAFCGGPGGFLALAATYGFTILAGKLSKSVREPIEQRLHARTGPRNAVQVLCNVGTGTVMLLLFALTEKPGFLWAYGGAMAASLADSLASELGVLSRGRPRDILSLRPVEKGLSGGVSPLGLGTSALGAVIVAALCGAFWGWELTPPVALSGFLAALLDSVLGSAVQGKYRCPACGALTEKPAHCGLPGSLERGLPFVDNNAVNLCNNVFGALAALGLYGLLFR